MKKLMMCVLVCLLLLAVPFSAFAASETTVVDVIEDYGAAGDGVTNDRAAIQQAIDAVHAAGGGTVTLTAGKTFLTTNIILKSNVTLHFGDGAKLKQCTDITAYVKPVDGGYESYTPLYGRNFTDTSVKYNHTWYSNYPFIYAGAGTSNVKVTGKGIIEMTPGAASNGSQTICICPIGFYRVTGYEISDITIQNYCTYAIMPYTTNKGLIKNVTIKDAVYGSGDGISLMNSQDIRITGCNITTNDDAVYIFSSYADPRAANWWSSDNPQPSKNIEIDHNKLTVTWLDTKAMGFILWGAGCPDQSLVEVKDIYIHDNQFNTMGIWNNHPYDSETRVVPMKNIRFENNIIADGIQSNFYSIPMSDVYGYDCMTTMINADFETTGEAYWVPVGSAGAAKDSVGQDGTWYGYINHTETGSELYQGLKLVGGQYYSFTAKTRTNGEICRMFVRNQTTQEIIATKEFVNTPWREVSMSFEIPTTGNYQIGIQSGDSTEGWAYIDSASLKLSFKEGSSHSIMTTQEPSDFDPELAKTYDLGTRFSATKAGTISKVRIYAMAGTNSTHQVRIWDYVSKTVIAGPYDWDVNATATGWIEFDLPEALHIDANKDYMVSVTNGVNDFYARGKNTTNNFAAPILNGDLVTYVGSGAYSTTVGTMPTSVNKNMNYFRDIVFTADENQPDTEPEEPTGDQTIFTNQIPNDYDPNKNNQYDLGTIFSAKKAGSITKVRIYAIAGTNSDHTIRIWDAETGTLLAKYENWSVTASADGWISYELPQALKIEADKQYMVSVTNGEKDYYPRGKTAPNNFDTPILNGDLVTYVGSGRWGYESDDTMPANNNKNMCYFRDIVFVAEEENTAAPIAGEQTIFDQQVPNTSRNDSFYELGTLFKTDCPGKITKVRLYTTSGESGVHTVRIWDYATATLLAGPYDWDVTAGIDGWQYFELPTALAIKADTDYVVAISNNSSNKIYSRGDQGGNNALEAPLTNGNLYTYAQSGLYTKTAGAMPNNPIVINYFRDVVFVADTVTDEPANTDSLQKVYDTAIALNENDYTETGWKAFQKSLNIARILLADENVTQAELDAAEKALTDNMNALVKVTILSDPVIELSDSVYTYDGTPKTPAVTVKDGDAVVDASEYTVSYENNSNAGTADVIISDAAGGSYNVSGRTTFTIEKAPVTVTANNQTAVIHGTIPELTYQVSGLIGTDTLTTAPTLTCDANLEVLGDYDITASGADAGGNYSVSYVKGILTVVEADKSALRELVNTMKAKEQGDYSDSSWNEFQRVLAAAESILTNPNATPQHIAAAETTLAAAEANLRPAKQVNAPEILLSQTVYTYDGTPKTPTVTLKDGDTLIPESEYEVQFANNVNAGTASVTITDKKGGEYIVSGSSSFSIAPAAVTVTADDKSAQIGGTMPEFTYQVTGLLNGDTLTAEPVLTCGADLKTVGTFDIVASDAKAGGNYTVSYVKGTLTVGETDKTSLQALVDECGDIQNDGYSGPTWNAFRNALEEARAVLNDPNATPEQVRTATSDLTAAVSGLAPIKVVTDPTISLEAASFVYNGKAHKPAVTVKDGNTLIPAEDYEVTYSDNVSVGTATVTIVPKTTGSYSVSGTATFTVTPAPITVIADNKTATVGGKLPALTYKVTGLCGSDKLVKEPVLKCDADMDTVGTYAITVSDAEAGGNYTVTMVNGKLTVNPPAATPPTGDPMNPVLLVLTMLLCLCMSVVLFKKAKFSA